MDERRTTPSVRPQEQDAAVEVCFGLQLWHSSVALLDPFDRFAYEMNLDAGGFAHAVHLEDALHN